MSRGHILVVDDERSLREFLTILLEQEGYEVTTADTVASGTEQVIDGKFDLVMCDLKLPDGSGLEVLAEGRKQQVESPFIIITAHTTPQHALEALRAGAAEYLSKPFNVDDLKLILEKLLGKGATEEDSQEVPNFIGSSPAIRRILDMVPRLAATPSTVFITGESGTGKELLAQAIHAFPPPPTAPSCLSIVAPCLRASSSPSSLVTFAARLRVRFAIIRGFLSRPKAEQCSSTKSVS